MQLLDPIPQPVVRDIDPREAIDVLRLVLQTRAPELLAALERMRVAVELPEPVEAPKPEPVAFAETQPAPLVDG